MNIQANTKHSYALFLISLGAVGLLIGVGCLVAGAIGLKGVLLGCGAVTAVPSLLMIRSGFRVRNRAVAAGSTVHIDPHENHWTSHTGTAKPSFLNGKKPPRDDDF